MTVATVRGLGMTTTENIAETDEPHLADAIEAAQADLLTVRKQGDGEAIFAAGVLLDSGDRSTSRLVARTAADAAVTERARVVS